MSSRAVVNFQAVWSYQIILSPPLALDCCRYVIDIGSCLRHIHECLIMWYELQLPTGQTLNRCLNNLDIDGLCLLHGLYRLCPRSRWLMAREDEMEANLQADGVKDGWPCAGEPIATRLVMRTPISSLRTNCEFCKSGKKALHKHKSSIMHLSMYVHPHGVWTIYYSCGAIHW